MTVMPPEPTIGARLEALIACHDRKAANILPPCPREDCDVAGHHYHHTVGGRWQPVLCDMDDVACSDEEPGQFTRCYGPRQP